MAVTWKKLAYEDDVITKAILTAAGDIIYASASATPAILAKGSDDDVLTLAAGVPSWAAPGAPAAHAASHLPSGGDPLTTAAPNALLEVQAQAEGTAESFARSDHDHAIVHDITDNALVTVDGSPADTEIAVWNADGLDGETPAEVAARMALDDIGVPDAAVDFNLQQATDLVVMTVANEAALSAVVADTEVGQLCWATGELTLHVCTESVA